MERGRTFEEEAAAIVRYIASGTHLSLTGGPLEPHSGWVLHRCMQEYGRQALVNVIHGTLNGTNAPAGFNICDKIILACSQTADNDVLDTLEYKFKTYTLPRFTYYSRPAGADKKGGAGSMYGEWVVEAAGGGKTVRTALSIENAECRGQKDLMDMRIRPRFLGYECAGNIPKLLMDGRQAEFTEKTAALKTVREAVGFLIEIITDI